MKRVLHSLWTLWLSTAGLILVWLVDVGAGWLPSMGSATIAAGCILVLLTWLLAKAMDVLRDGGGEEAVAKRWALGLLVLALVVRLVGIQFELTDPPRSDEGVYMVESEEINKGDLFPDTFNYGHFLYYAGALTLWLQETFPRTAMGVFSLLYGAETPFEVSRLLLKSINALLGALTGLAMFAVARRVAGLTAGVLSALLIVFSPLYNDISQQVICDVPSGYFAALCMVFVARLLDGERLRDYLLAGVAAGLAAGSKYPGGVVAIAILGMWLYWRWKRRNWSWSLVLAGLVSICTLLAVMPAFFFARGEALSGQGLDLFFGFRQYAFGGWLGVQPESPGLWYGEKIVGTFGWPAVILGLCGLLLLTPSVRRRLALLSAFPLGYLVLISAMSMVVRRNLQPVLPMLAVILGVGLAGWLAWLRRYRPRWSPGASAFVLGAVALLLPTIRTVAWDISRVRPGTRQLARQWIEENVPDGASILKEGYTSQLDLERYHVQHLRFAAWMPEEMLFSETWDYLLLARNAHLRFMRPEALTRDHEREYAERYQRIFDTLELVHEFEPHMLRAGSHMFLYRVEPHETVYRRERTFSFSDATWVSDAALQRLGEGKPLMYTRKWQYAVFKDFFLAGDYRVTMSVDKVPEEGYLYVVTPDNEEIGTWDVNEVFEISLPRDGKYLFRVFLAPPTRLYGWTLQSMESHPQALESDADDGASP
jgi:4-amino-4-deoxy-L-arabinose transferase-like glycosyltransferase